MPVVVGGVVEVAYALALLGVVGVFELGERPVGDGLERYLSVQKGAELDGVLVVLKKDIFERVFEVVVNPALNDNAKYQRGDNNAEKDGVVPNAPAVIDCAEKFFHLQLSSHMAVVQNRMPSLLLTSAAITMQPSENRTEKRPLT